MIFRKNVDFGVLNSVAEEIFVAIVGFLKFDFMMKIWYYRFWQFDFEFIDDQIFEIFFFFIIFFFQFVQFKGIIIIWF